MLLSYLTLSRDRGGTIYAGSDSHILLCPFRHYHAKNMRHQPGRGEDSPDCFSEAASFLSASLMVFARDCCSSSMNLYGMHRDRDSSASNRRRGHSLATIQFSDQGWGGPKTPRVPPRTHWRMACRDCTVFYTTICENTYWKITLPSSSSMRFTPFGTANTIVPVRGLDARG